VKHEVTKVILVPVCGVPNRKQRIVGGQVTKVNEFPWIVALIKRGKFYCAGSLITRRHVITAAHCADGWVPCSEYLSSEQTLVVFSVISHFVHTNSGFKATRT